MNWKKVIGFWLGGALLALLSGCATANPAHVQCLDSCRSEKNSCMIQASTADAVKGCDEKQNSCLTGCQQIPATL